MKVTITEAVKQEFKPVAVQFTIESFEELDTMKQLFGADSMLTDNIYELFEEELNYNILKSFIQGCNEQMKKL
jgi:hypothetical protein